VIDPNSGPELHLIEHGGWVYAVAFDPQGRFLATAIANGEQNV
jgi:hypothetical protein